MEQFADGRRCFHGGSDRICVDIQFAGDDRRRAVGALSKAVPIIDKLKAIAVARDIERALITSYRDPIGEEHGGGGCAAAVHSMSETVGADCGSIRKCSRCKAIAGERASEKETLQLFAGVLPQSFEHGKMNFEKLADRGVAFGDNRNNFGEQRIRDVQPLIFRGNGEGGKAGLRKGVYFLIGQDAVDVSLARLPLKGGSKAAGRADSLFLAFDALCNRPRTVVKLRYGSHRSFSCSKMIGVKDHILNDKTGFSTKSAWFEFSYQLERNGRVQLLTNLAFRTAAAFSRARN